MLSSLIVVPQVTPKAVSDHNIYAVLQIYILSCWVLYANPRWLPLCNLHQRHFPESLYYALSLALPYIVCMFENNLWLNYKSGSILLWPLVLQNSDINAILAYSSIADSKYLTPSLNARDLTWLVCGLGSNLKAINLFWIVFEIFIAYLWKGCSILFLQTDSSFSTFLLPLWDGPLLFWSLDYTFA